MTITRATGLLLVLVDRAPHPGRRARFYRLRLQPSLFGGVDLVREWGRLEPRFHPRRLVDPHPDEASACVSVRQVLRARLARGYTWRRQAGGMPDP